MPTEARLTDIRLPDEFLQAGEAAWRAEVEKVLKGADFDKRLVKSTADGIAIKPLYSAGDEHPLSIPLRPVAEDVERPWEVRSVVDAADTAEANRQALQDLQGGAASILIRIDPAAEMGVGVGGQKDFDRILQGVFTELAPIALDAGYLGPLAADWLGEAAKSAPNAPLAFHMDPVSALLESGKSEGPIESHIIAAAETGARWAVPYARASLFLASGRTAHEAGGSEAQELALALSSGLVYAKALVRAGLPLSEALSRIVLGLSADETYFVSLAKLRAARLLWSRLTGALGAATRPVIEARSSRRMLSKLDPWVNLLRQTAAVFAAGLGGADQVLLEAFTAPLGRADDFARRQARNTQLILMEEANLGRVADPAAGSRFLDSLTDELARAAYAEFQRIESEGGLIESLRTGAFQTRVDQTRAARLRDIATRKTGLIGTSEFPILNQAAPAVAPTDPAAFAKPVPRTSMPGPDSIVRSLAPWRKSEPYEALRARADKLGSKASAILATLGGLKDYSARQGFSANALAAGGVSTTTLPVEAVSNTPLVVVCGSDDGYQALGVEAIRGLKSRGVLRVIVAGRPEESLKTAGADAFIYAGADLVSVLGDILEGIS